MFQLYYLKKRVKALALQHTGLKYNLLMKLPWNWVETHAELNRLLRKHSVTNLFVFFFYKAPEISADFKETIFNYLLHCLNKPYERLRWHLSTRAMAEWWNRVSAFLRVGWEVEKEGESAEEQGLMGENKPRKKSVTVEIVQSVGCSPHIN